MLRGLMEGKAKGTDIARLYEALGTPQFKEARALRHAHAMTDVTGFGLAGHAAKMASASGATLVIERDTVRFFDGALSLAEQGVRSSLYTTNRAALPAITDETAETALLFDPQTAGGFLAALPPGPIPDGASRIGYVEEGPSRLSIA